MFGGCPPAGPGSYATPVWPYRTTAAPEPSTAPILETLVAQNALLMQALATQRLGGAGEGAADLDSSSSSAVTGARGAAALERFAAIQASKPQEVVTEVRRNLARMVGSTADSPQDALEYIRRHGGFGGKPDLGECMNILSSVWNDLELGKVDEAHAKVAMGMVAVDQASRDRRWEIATLVGNFPRASPEAMSRYPVKDLLQPSSPLAAPRWIAAAQQYIREASSTEESFRRYTGKNGKKGKDKKGDGQDA